MTESRGKKFEHNFLTDFQTYVPLSFCYRLYDNMSGFLGVAGVADFICYKNPYLLLIDCKSHEGNTISFSDFSQYDRMLPYKDIPGVFSGTVVWFCDKDLVVWIPIQTWEKLKLDGKKSFNVKYIDSGEYECLVIPSKKKRVFMESNYSVLIDWCKEQDGRI